jgi:hypothetical protein
MTRRADYTRYEWALLQTAIELVALRMLSVSRSGPIGKLRELAALSTCLSLRALPKQFKRNELVLSLLEDIGVQAQAPLASGDVNRLAVALANARLQTLPCCEEIADLLADKTPWAEADGVKRWLLWVASSVAEASGDGWLGWGRRVSSEESRMLRQIATALRISASATVPSAPNLDNLEAMQDV